MLRRFKVSYRISLSANLNIYFIQEAELGIIELEDDDPKVVHTMLRYSYGAEMIFTSPVYALADKYDITAPKIFATAKFEAVAKAAWSTTNFPHH